jgi:hypothetical protein
MSSQIIKIIKCFEQRGVAPLKPHIKRKVEGNLGFLPDITIVYYYNNYNRIREDIDL